MLLVLVFSVYIGYRILTYDYMSTEEIENAKLYRRTLRIFFAQVFLKYHGPNHLARLWCAYCVELSGLSEPT